jgi:hypothetical protein
VQAASALFNNHTSSAVLPLNWGNVPRVQQSTEYGSMSAALSSIQANIGNSVN